MTDISVQPHFGNSVSLCAERLGDSASKAEADPKLMMRLSPDQLSSSALHFTIYVALAFVGLDIFEFSCHNNNLEVPL